MIWAAIWDGFMGFLLFRLLGFLLGLAVLFVLYSKGLLKREKTISKVFVVLYWILIPLFTSWEFAALKTIHIIETTAKNSADLAIEQLEVHSFPAFQNFVSKNTGNLMDGKKIPSNEELANSFFEKSSIKSSWISKSVLVWLLDLMEEIAEENVSEQTGIAKENVHAFRLMQGDAIDGLFSEAMLKLKNTSHKLIGATFFPYYFVSLLIWLGCMILPIIEIFLFAKNRRKKSTQINSQIPD